MLICINSLVTIPQAIKTYSNWLKQKTIFPIQFSSSPWVISFNEDSSTHIRLDVSANTSGTNKIYLDEFGFYLKVTNMSFINSGIEWSIDNHSYGYLAIGYWK